jgi:hypothetical protein
VGGEGQEENKEGRAGHDACAVRAIIEPGIGWNWYATRKIDFPCKIWQSCAPRAPKELLLADRDGQRNVKNLGVDETKRANVEAVAAGGGMKHRRKDNNRRENEQKQRLNAPSIGFATSELGNMSRKRRVTLRGRASSSPALWPKLWPSCLPARSPLGTIELSLCTAETTTATVC